MRQRQVEREKKTTQIRSGIKDAESQRGTRGEKQRRQKKRRHKGRKKTRDRSQDRGKTNRGREEGGIEGWRNKARVQHKREQNRESALLRGNDFREIGGNPRSEHFWQTAHRRLSPAVQHCNTRYASLIQEVQKMDCYLQDITGWRMKMNTAYPLKGSLLVLGRGGAHVEQSLL